MNNRPFACFRICIILTFKYGLLDCYSDHSVLLSNVCTVLRARSPPCKANRASISHCEPLGYHKPKQSSVICTAEQSYGDIKAKLPCVDNAFNLNSRGRT